MAQQQRTQNENELLTNAMNTFQNDVMEPVREKIMNLLTYTKDKDGNMVVAPYNPNTVKGLIPMVTRYNQLARKAGLEQLDLNNLNNIAQINRPNLKYQFGPNGTLLGIDQNTGQVSQLGNYAAHKFIQGKNGHIIDTTDAGLAKDTGIRAGGVHFQDQGGKTIMYSDDGKVLGQFDKTLSAKERADVALRQAAQNQEAQKIAIAQQNADTNRYKAIGGDTTGDESAIRGGMDPKSAQIAQRIDDLKAQGWSSDDIKAELDNSGYSAYKAWVPD